MVARAFTVAFEGVEARLVEVQCALSPGMPAFHLVGLPDKAVSEAKERVRAAMNALSIALPSKRITVNLSPADLPKEGSHFDLPIALALMAALEIIPKDEVEGTIALGELALDGRLIPVIGALPAAMCAAEEDKVLLCPKACGAEAAWVGATQVLGAASLHEVLRHYTNQSVLTPAEAGEVVPEAGGRDLRDVKGQAIAPGFVNMLSWATESLLIDGRAQSDIRQGVTLEIMGEGSSMGPLNPDMKRLWAQRQFQVPLRHWWLMGIGGLLVGAIGPTSVLRSLTGRGWTWKGRSLAQP